jgi:ribosomal protein S18 acetylase RimI-like enzyme
MATRHPSYATNELSSKTWGDFERLFRKPGEWGNCQCMWFHREGPRPKEEQLLPSKERNEKNFQTQKQLVELGRSHGILVYSDRDPIGWCQYGLREEFPRIDNAAKYRAVPPVEGNMKLWRITCFCVDKKYRNQGVAKTGLHVAMSSIRKKGGGVVEAYPSTRKEGLALHRGNMSMFKKEGFYVVSPLGPCNLVVRRKSEAARNPNSLPTGTMSIVNGL